MIASLMVAAGAVAAAGTLACVLALWRVRTVLCDLNVIRASLLAHEAKLTWELDQLRFRRAENGRDQGRDERAEGSHS